MTEWTRLPDLASRAVGGGVVWANDELFAERENLIKPAEPVYQTYTFGHKGQIYDGWETRRRREPGVDQAVIRLGLPGVVRGVVIDTTNFSKVRFVTEEPVVEGNPVITAEYALIERSTVISRRSPPDKGVLDLTLTGDDVVFDNVVFIDCRLEGWFRPEWFRNSSFERCALPEECRLADVAYFSGMQFRAGDPHWEGRDRFLLSAGHYAIALYAALIEAFRPL